MRECAVFQFSFSIILRYAAADRYPEGASSNPARVNIFQLTSAVSDYHEKFLYTTTDLRLLVPRKVTATELFLLFGRLFQN